MKKIHYESSGDNYKLKDPFKVLALESASKTSHNLARFKKYGIEITEIQSSRGDSAYRIGVKSNGNLDFQLAHVEESIGTKNVIADELIKLFGKSFYYQIAIDNVASIVNDLSTTGASPLSFMLHLAAYPNEWFLDEKIFKPLLAGTVEACNLAGLSWGGGESGTDRDIIIPGRSLLSGSCTGIIFPSSKALSEEKLKAGDRIILLGSSGVHTNGITLLRKELLAALPEGYKTTLSDGTTYGESLMTPSVIYSRLVEEAVWQTEVHYSTHITGHGWRKIMRAKRSFSYILIKYQSQPIFETIKKYSGSAEYDMYDTYNMGAGFVLFVPQKSVLKILSIARKYQIPALDAGFIENGSKRVVINPIGVEFTSEDLQIR